MFSSSFSATVITLFRDALVIAYAYALANPFNRGFKLYVNACIASSVARSGRTTTILLI